MGIEISVIVFDSAMLRSIFLVWDVSWLDGTVEDTQRHGSSTASEPSAGKIYRKRALGFAPLKSWHLVEIVS